MNPGFAFFGVAILLLIIAVVVGVKKPKQALDRKVFGDPEDVYQPKDQKRVSPAALQKPVYDGVDYPTSPCCDRPMVRVVGSTLVCASCMAPFRRAVWVNPQPLFEGEWERDKVFSGRAPETGTFTPMSQKGTKLATKRVVRKKKARRVRKVAAPTIELPSTEENPS